MIRLRRGKKESHEALGESKGKQEEKMGIGGPADSLQEELNEVNQELKVLKEALASRDLNESLEAALRMGQSTFLARKTRLEDKLDKLPNAVPGRSYPWTGRL